MQHVVLVDPDCAGLEGTGDADGGVEVFGVHGRREAVGCHVAEADRVGFIFEFGDGAHRAEDFFLHDFHVFAHVGEDGRLDEVAFFAVAFAPDFDLGAFFFACIDIARVCQYLALVNNIGFELYPMMRSNCSCDTCGP